MEAKHKLNGSKYVFLWFARSSTCSYVCVYNSSLCHICVGKIAYPFIICLCNAGALMVLTLKVISCAINYSDGILKEEGLREAQKKYRLTKLPSLIEYFGYCLCCGSHFAGPVYEMKDYLDWTERKGVSSLHLLLVGLCRV